MYRSFSGLKVCQYVSGSANQTITCKTPGSNGILVLNDSGADMTIAINGITCTVKTGEAFDEVFEPFNTVGVTATGAYRIFIKA